jgi:hypothetical protein
MIYFPELKSAAIEYAHVPPQTRHHDTVMSENMPEVHSQGETMMDNAKIIEAA